MGAKDYRPSPPFALFPFRLFSLGSSFSPPLSSFLKDVIFIPNVVKGEAKEERSCETAFDNGNETQETVQLKLKVELLTFIGYLASILTFNSNSRSFDCLKKYKFSLALETGLYM